MELLKGAPVSAAIREWAAEEIKQLQGSVPKLAIIRVGEKPDDMSYERSAVKDGSLWAEGADLCISEGYFRRRV